MKKILLLLLFLLISMVGISQLRNYSTNRLDYGKLIRVGITYELVYPDYHAWDLYILSGLDMYFWDWYIEYYAWRYTPFAYRNNTTYNYRTSQYYWYASYYSWWYYTSWYNYRYWNHYSYPNETNITYGRRPINNTKPNVIRERTDDKPIRTREPRNEVIRNEKIRPEISKRPERDVRKPKQYNPTYKQPKRETIPKFNDSRPNINSRPNRVEQRPVNSQGVSKSSGKNTTSGERKR